MQHDGARRRLLLAAVLGLVGVGVAYRDTFASIGAKWESDAAYSHGYLVVPLVLWLAWLKREDVIARPWIPAPAGVVLLLAAILTWTIARGVGVLVIEQYAAVAMVPSLLLAVLGWSACRALGLPLAMLFFAVPVGRALVPTLMQLTADLATWALHLSGVPILRNHMHISIPSGQFEVAKACSGLKFLVAGSMLGVLYSFLTYRKWWKRVVSMLAFIVVPVVLNGVRVYITIGVSHLTSMNFGPGSEHIAFGMVFFVATMFLMFWVGRRWRDDEPRPSTVRPGPDERRVGAGAWIVVCTAVLLPMSGPPYLRMAVAHAATRPSERDGIAALPTALSGWTGPRRDRQPWRPRYTGSLSESSAVYTEQSGGQVDVYVGVYGLGVTSGSEMISYANRLSDRDRGSLETMTLRSLRFDDGTEFDVREQVLRLPFQENRIVWTWFVVGERATPDPFRAKALEAFVFVTQQATDERVVTLATTAEEGARARLESFVRTHARCVRGGFRRGLCDG